MLGLVGEARLAIQDYGRRALAPEEVQHVGRVFNLGIHVVELDVPAVLYPPIGGCYRLAVQSGLPLEVRRYLTLHEVGHILLGEAEEPMRLVFFGALPESEDACDLFALLGVIDPVHDPEGPDWLELKIRETVPLEDRGWQQHRIPRLARKLPQVRQLVFDRLDGDFFEG